VPVSLSLKDESSLSSNGLIIKTTSGRRSVYTFSACLPSKSRTLLAFPLDIPICGRREVDNSGI
jgi:hypothetical protein